MYLAPPFYPRAYPRSLQKAHAVFRLSFVRVCWQRGVVVRESVATLGHSCECPCHFTMEIEMETRFRFFSACILAALLIWSVAAEAENVTVDQSNANDGSLLNNALVFGGLTPIRSISPGGPTTSPPGVGILSNKSEEAPLVARLPGYRIPNTKGMDFLTDSKIRMSVTAAGFVGIGTTTPTKIFEIDNDGDVELGLRSTTAGRLWTIQSSSGQSQDATLNGTFQVIDRTLGKARLVIDAQGIVTVSVLKITGGSDVAEPFKMDRQGIPKVRGIHRRSSSGRAYDEYAGLR